MATAQQLQAQQLQKQLMAQQLMLQQQASFLFLDSVLCTWRLPPFLYAFVNRGVCFQALSGSLLASNKKQREVYVGNLTIGVVNDNMLRELFNGALAHLVPNAAANPPVISVGLDGSGEVHSPE